MYSCAIVDTFTGDVLHRPLPSEGPWKTFANGIGDGSTKFRLRDAEQPKIDAARWQDVTEPWARTLVLSNPKTGKAVYAGILEDDEWAADEGVLTLTHRELRGILRKRLTSDLPRFRTDGALLFLQKSLRGVLRNVAEYALRHEPGSIWHLPVVIPADEAGGYDYKWPHTKFDSIDSVIAQLTDTVGGPDLWFQPRWRADGRFEWVAVIGSPRIPGSRIDLNVAAAEHPVVGLRRRRDGARQLTGVFALGAGSEADMLVGRAGAFEGPNIPAMDSAESFKAVEDKPQLDSLAAATLRTFRSPTKSYSYGLDAGSVDLGGTLNIGARPRLFLPGDEFLPADDEWQPEGYLVSLSGDVGSSTIGMGVQQA